MAASGTQRRRAATRTGRVCKRLCACATVAIVAVAFFLALHHVGNGIPYDLAKRQLAVALDAAHANESYVLGFSKPWGFCEMSLAVLGGAASTGGFRDAVQLKKAGARFRRPCDALALAVASDDPGAESIIKTRYWWGGKALYAIALRHMSVAELRKLTETATYVAYAALALALLALSPKAFLVASPLIAFGALFSGVRHFADVEHGVPYLLTVLGAAMLASLMLVRRWMPQVWPAEDWTPGMRLFCFAFGMASSYVWLGDGHGLLAVTWLGLVAYFGSERFAVAGGDAARVRSAASCVGAYLVGFLASYFLGIAVKLAALGAGVWADLLRRSDATLNAAMSGEEVMDVRELLGRYYVMMDLMDANAVIQVVPFALLLTLLVSVLFAAFSKGSHRRGLGTDVSVVVCLMLAHVPQFLLEEHVPFRTARYVSVMHALPLSCLVLALMAMTMRTRLVVVGGLSGCAWLAYAVQSHWREREAAQIATSRPAVRSVFDVHLRDDAVYWVRDPCTERDVEPRFMLLVFPSDPADLPPRRRPQGFIALDFPFARGGRFTDGSEGLRKCTTRAPLPDYPLARIRTGQFVWDALSWKATPLWSASFTTDQRGLAAGVQDALRAVAGRPPTARSRFDVHLHQGRLTYLRAPCKRGDAKERFFLHVIPESPDDLPAESETGFHNLDFDFWEHGGVFDDRCVATVPLPGYAVAAIRTGQWTRGAGPVWQVEIEGNANNEG